MRTLIRAALITAALYASGSTSAQQLPDTVRAAGVTVAQWRAVQDEVRRAAAARGASERALAAVAERVSANLVVNGHIDLDQVLHSIDDRAQQVADLQHQLAAMEAADDPAITVLLTRAHAAIEVGDLSRGDELLMQAAQSDIAGIARDQATLAARRTRAAQTIAERGRLAYVSADYLGAANLYSQAAATAPSDDATTQWRYRMGEGESYYQRGYLFNEPAPLHDAATLYRDIVERLASRQTRPQLWAATQNRLGIVLELLGERGDTQALRDATTVSRSVLEVQTRERAPRSWADEQNNLGVALRYLGGLGDGKALRESIVHFRLALEIYTRADHPSEWARTQSNLGMALATLGQNGDEQALRDAVTTYRAALQVESREEDPHGWASTQGNLAHALYLLGDEASVHDAIAAIRSALDVETRESSPAQWASLQYTLGNALLHSGQTGNREALSGAIAAFRAALEVERRETSIRNWAWAEFGLALALHFSALFGDSSQEVLALQAARAAADGFAQSGESGPLEATQRLIASIEMH